MVKSSESSLDDLKEQKVSCLNFDKLADNLKLPNAKEFEIKMRDLNPDLQALFSLYSTIKTMHGPINIRFTSLYIYISIESDLRPHTHMHTGRKF